MFIFVLTLEGVPQCSTSKVSHKYINVCKHIHIHIHIIYPKNRKTVF